MVPASGDEKRLRSILNFSHQLYNSLPDAQDDNDARLLLAEVGTYTQHLIALKAQGNESTAKDFERQARDLWNLCLRQARARNNGAEGKGGGGKLIHKVRVFAFYMLVIGRESPHRTHGEDSGAEAAYLLKLALTTAKYCAQAEDVESGKLVLQQASVYVERLKGNSDLQETGEDRTYRYDMDYLTMRIALSWKDDQLDVAERTFSKIGGILQRCEAVQKEALADVLHHIGLTCLLRKDFTMALKWQKRAQQTLPICEVDTLSLRGLEIKLAICQCLVRTYIGIGTTQALRDAESIVTDIETQLGDKPVILHWHLELLQHSPREEVNPKVYANLLRRMVRAFDNSDENLDFLLHHIKELGERDIELASALLDELLLQRVVPSKRCEHVGKVLIRRVWSAVKEEETDDRLHSLTNVLNSLHNMLPEPMDPAVAGAAHSLNDCEKGRQAFADLPSEGQQNPLTSYLMFRLALLDWNHDLGRQCVENLSRSCETSQCHDMLYACIKEAQHAGDKICTLEAMKAVTNSKWTEHGMMSNYPSLLRCTIRLLVMIEEGEDSGEELAQSAGSSAEDLCTAFEQGAALAKQDPRDENDNRIYTMEELHWFRKNAYNIAVTKSQTWPLSQLVRILNACLTYTEVYPSDLPLAEATEIALMRMRCHFIAAAALVSMARTQDLTEEKLQRYVEMRQHIAAFDESLQMEAEAQDEAVIQDLIGKATALFVFDFEGAVALRSWDELGQIVRKAKMCREENMLKAMGDCLLRSQAPGRVVFGTMGLIINEIFELEFFDSEKLAKYLRCVFQAILPLDDNMALQLLDQAIEVARESQYNHRPFPHTELEWLIASTFNRAVDLYARRKGKETCHRWALKALELATFVEDEGRLRDMLQERLAKLTFEH